jgi:hypothetical protein
MIAPMDRLVVASKWKPAFDELGLSSCGAVLRHFPNPQTATTVCVEHKLFAVPGRSTVPVFYKLYNYRTPSWKFVGRKSKARCEYENYAALHNLGIATAEALAWGERRDWLGRLRAAFIITQEIPRAWTLPQFVAEHCPGRTGAADKALRNSLWTQLATMTRQCHDAGFFYYDLYWRNILVTWQPPAEPKLWFIDCPRGGFDRWSPLRRHRRIKDLAALDKSAANLCSRCERLDFVKRYLGKTEADTEVKQLVRTVLAYRKRRWPDEWP